MNWVCEKCFLFIGKKYIENEMKYYHKSCYQLELDNNIAEFLAYFDKICKEENNNIKSIKISTIQENHTLVKKIKILVDNDYIEMLF